FAHYESLQTLAQPRCGCMISQRQRRCTLQPNVARLCGYVGLTSGKNHTNRNAVASLPDVPFIPFDPMPLQQFAQLILETRLSVMLFLMSDVILDLLQIRFTH